MQCNILIFDKHKHNTAVSRMFVDFLTKQITLNLEILWMIEHTTCKAQLGLNKMNLKIPTLDILICALKLLVRLYLQIFKNR